jgi:hypothetical protein
MLTVEFVNLVLDLKLLPQEKKDIVAFMRALSTAARARGVSSGRIPSRELTSSVSSQAGSGGMGRLGVPNTISVIALMLRLP